MARKVKLAIFDNDLRAKVGKYEVNKDGTKIIVIPSGEGYHAPSFDNDSFIEFPYRAITSFWRKSYRKVFFVKRKGKKCVNFKTDPPVVFPPDEEELKRAVGSTMLGQIGKDKQDITWVGYVTLALVAFQLLNTLGVFS